MTSCTFVQPRGGISDPAVKPGDVFLARVPIYETKNAGRGLWNKIRKLFVRDGLTENCVYSEIYAYVVDDLFWVCEQEAEWLIDKLKLEFKLGKEKKRNSASVEHNLGRPAISASRSPAGPHPRS